MCVCVCAKTVPSSFEIFRFFKGPVGCLCVPAAPACAERGGKQAVRHVAAHISPLAYESASKIINILLRTHCVGCLGSGDLSWLSRGWRRWVLRKKGYRESGGGEKKTQETKGELGVEWWVVRARQIRAFARWGWERACGCRQLPTSMCRATQGSGAGYISTVATSCSQVDLSRFA